MIYVLLYLAVAVLTTAVAIVLMEREDRRDHARRQTRYGPNIVGDFQPKNDLNWPPAVGMGLMWPLTVFIALFILAAKALLTYVRERMPRV